MAAFSQKLAKLHGTLFVVRRPYFRGGHHSYYSVVWYTTGRGTGVYQTWHGWYGRQLGAVSVQGQVLA